MDAADIAFAVDQARDAENATHTDLCDITRPDPDSPGGWNPDTGATAAGMLPVYTDLPCRLRSPSQSDRAAVAGEHQFQVGDAVLRLDAGTTGVRIGDTVTMTTSPQGVATGGTFMVVWPIFGSHMSSARFVVRRAG